MTTIQSALTLYGSPLSQPVRAVIWLLLLKKMPFELILMNPGSKGEIGTRNPNFLKKNPNGTIPFLEDNATDVAMAEAHAILVYLCRKNAWFDLYPSEPAKYTKIDWYLHAHHRGIREASLAFFAPNVRKDLVFSETFLDNAKKMFRRSLQSLEQGWLDQSRFIAGDSRSICDLAAYVEIGQLRPRFTNLFDFEPFPNVRRWLDDMAATDSHDEAHTSLTVLGDISVKAPGINTIKEANKRGYSAVMKRQSLYR
jgi:glutathione S-transferase